MNSEKCTTENTINVNNMLNNMTDAENTANNYTPNIEPKKTDDECGGSNGCEKDDIHADPFVDGDDIDNDDDALDDADNGHGVDIADNDEDDNKDDYDDGMHVHGDGDCECGVPGASVHNRLRGKR